MARNHYISKFLIQPWRQKGLPLWHYNFAQNSFSEKYSSDTLFAKRNLWPDHIEKFLQKHTENFSSGFINRISNLDTTVDLQSFKAIFLLTLFQAARVAHFQTGESTIERLSVYSEKHLEMLIEAAKAQKKLVAIKLPENLRFFFPDTGIFPFPIAHNGTFKWMFSLPLTGRSCVGLIPTEVDLAQILREFNYEALVGWSAGTSKSCNRVVIHPDLYSFKKNPELLAQELIRFRGHTQEQLARVDRFNLLNNLTTSISLSFV